MGVVTLFKKDMSIRFTFICLFSLCFSICGQSDFISCFVGNGFKGTSQIENLSLGTIEAESFTGGHMDFTWASTIESKYFLVMDGSALTFFNMGKYNFGLFDTRMGVSLHAKHPIRIGEQFELIFGVGGALGFKIFNAETRASFLAYGLTFSGIINLGENFQLLYLNTITPGFNRLYSEMSRTKHEFFFSYNIRDKIMVAVSPYIETFYFIEAGKPDLDYTQRFKGLRVGITKRIN